MEILLSICIPTYYRVRNLLNLLDVIKQEINGLEDNVEIIVSDNNTESYQLNELIIYSENNPFFKLYLQDTNNGFIGNYNFLIDKSQGKYTWILGDDDLVTPGSLKHIVSILDKNEENIGCLHLKYNHYLSSVTDLKYPLVYDYGKSYGIISDVNEYILTFSGKGLVSHFMLISVNILNSQLLKSLRNQKQRYDLSDPLYYSLICAKYGLYIDDHISVSQNIEKGIITWRSVAKDVHLYITPSTIMSIPDFYYSYELKKHIVFNYFKNSYLSLFFFFGLTTKKNNDFFNTTFALYERMKLYICNISYVIKKVSYKCIYKSSLN